MKLYLISRPNINSDGLDSFMEDENLSWNKNLESSDSESLIEIAGRICHMSFGNRQVTETNHLFINNILARGHDSVLEHATWSFIATGLSRSFTHQIVRHRIGFSFSQMSQQFVDQESSKFVVPPGFEDDQDVLKELEEAEKATKKAYENLKKIIRSRESGSEVNKTSTQKQWYEKLLRSAARGILPNCTETKLFFTANGRSIRHFLKLRGGIVWDLEMRLFCHKLLLIMKDEANNIFRDFCIEIHEDGYPIIRHSSNMV